MKPSPKSYNFGSCLGRI